MNRTALATTLLAVAAPWALVAARPGDAPAPTAKAAPALAVPPGFEVELVAGRPLVDRPVVADFDDEGRLYVADSSGSNDPVGVQLQKRPHRVVRLTDTDGDGKFDRSEVFADRLMFPSGAMWLRGSFYTATPPSIWKLTDADGDGKAERREEWFRGKTLTGCANDLHGPYAGPDGWVYWTKGAFARQTYERPGRPPFVTRAAHIFRARPDGTGIEPVMTGGMDNPVEVVFTPGGERVFTTTFFQHPGGGRRDGLVHAVYGGVYGKDHDVVYEHPWTGPALMPVMTHLGAAAPSGLVRYQSEVFGPQYRDNLFAALFNLHRITRHVLEASGATFKTRDEDFLVSTDLDFHPTDVLEDADGSLLVVNTGGWYKLCCPTSQLHKPDVLGGIYRVRRKGAPRVEDPWGKKIAWPKLSPAGLAGLLDDARPAVRRRAVAALAAGGVGAIPTAAEAARTAQSTEARRNAVWAATRIQDAGARAIARAALADKDETVRQVAAHSVSVWRDRDAVQDLVELLKDGTPHNCRAAAEALGRIGDKSAVPALLEAAAKPVDRALEHSVTYALIETGDREGTAAGLKATSPLTRRAALAALDQMPGGGLAAASVTAELAAKDPALKETAWWVAGRHPEWGGELAGFLRGRLAATDLSGPEADELVGQLARLAKSAAVQDLLAGRLSDPATPLAERRRVLRVMAQAGLGEAPDSWAVALIKALAGHDADALKETVAAVRAVRVSKAQGGELGAGLRKVGDDSGVPLPVRLQALAAVTGGLAQVPGPLFDLLREQLDREKPVAVRSAAADVLSRAKLTPNQLAALAESLKTTGPMEVGRLLDAFAASGDDRVGAALVAALKESPVKAALRPDALKPRLAKFGPAVQKAAETLYAELNTDAAQQKAKLEQLLGSLSGGDIRRGQAVFASAKAACSSCHAIGYLGGRVGPDLTQIGKLRSERDLLESIVFPSASFVRSYEPVQVTTKAGVVHNGILKKDAPDEVVLATDAEHLVRVAREEIEDMVPGTVSIMPAGLDQQLTPGELADLVTFLKSCK